MHTKAKCIRTIDIVEADAAGASLQLSFEHLFLRKPNKGETDIVFSTEDLERLAAHVWSSLECRPPGGAATGLPPGACPPSGWGSPSVLGEGLRSTRVTVGPYGSLPISHSPTVPPLFTRPLPSSTIAWRPPRLPLGPVNCVKGLSITCRRPSYRVTGKNEPPKASVVPTHPFRAVTRSDAKIPIPPGRPFRYLALVNTAYVGLRLLAAQH